MLRVLLWLAVYILSLGSISIRVRYTDGLEIQMTGWVEKLAEWRAKNTEGEEGT